MSYPRRGFIAAGWDIAQSATALSYATPKSVILSEGSRSYEPQSKDPDAAHITEASRTFSTSYLGGVRYRMAASATFNHVGEYDENLPIPQRLTLAQYRRVIFRPDAHFIDGEIIPRNLGDSIHGHAIGNLSSALYAPCKNLGLHVCISLRLQTSLDRIRVCDLAVLDPTNHDAVPTNPPLLCIEVLAPNQPRDSELPVLTDYLNMGVPNIWLIDPIRRSAFTFDTQGLHEADPTRLTAPNTPIHLDLTEAFAAID